MKIIVTLALCAAAVAGCAAPDVQTTQQTAAPSEEKVYRTGSNIPQKDRGDVKSVSGEAAANAIRSAPPPPGRTGQ
jgi:hypothetical protein